MRPLAKPQIRLVSIKTTPKVMEALSALRDTGFFGNGHDRESVAEELLRRALLLPDVACFWKKGTRA